MYDLYFRKSLKLIDLINLDIQFMTDQENKRRRRIGHYDVLRTIGKGGFGTVNLCEDEITKERYAIKEIELPKSRSKINPKEEIEIHKILAKKRSNRFVKIHEDFEDSRYVYLVMEYCKEGSLRDYVKHNGEMGVLLATDVLAQLCDALKLIHEEDIAHRDLTPNNVLIWEIMRGQNGEVKRIRVKVTDFGLSKKTPKDAMGQFKTTLGTGPFMAPEVKQGRYTKQADMFSLGSVFYFLLTMKYLPDKNMSGKQLELGPILSKLMAMPSVSKLNGEVQENLKAFLRGMLCSEENRIRLNEVDEHQFMRWFYSERFEIDPELRDLCSHSQSGPYGKGRLNRNRSNDSLKIKPVPEVQKRSNKDSALGSDQQHSHSSSSRCRHPQIDCESGRCRTCPYRKTTTTNSNGTMDMAFRHKIRADDFHNSEPIAPRNKQIYMKNTINRPLQATTSHTIAVRTDPIIARNASSNEDGNNVYHLKRPPWPFPIVTSDYSTANGHGRCIWYGLKYSFPRKEMQLVAILEKTISESNLIVKRIFELHQNDSSDQELRIFEPENSNIKRPEKNAEKIKKARELVRIKSYKELKNSDIAKEAKEGYDTLWSFLRQAASKIIIANIEEIANERKYRVGLCLNGWAYLYIGPKNSKQKTDLKYYSRQKSENGRFEESDMILHREEYNLMMDLAMAVRKGDRGELNLRAPKYKFRNIRFTNYSEGYK